MPNVKSPNRYKNTNYNKSARKLEVVTTAIDWGGRYFKACEEKIDDGDTEKARNERVKHAQKRSRLLNAWIANPIIISTNQSIDDDDA